MRTPPAPVRGERAMRMRCGTGWKTVGILVGVVVALVGVARTAGGPPRMRRSGGLTLRATPADRPAPPEPPPVHVFGGSEVNFPVSTQGKPVPWWLTHERLVLARGTFRPGRDGTGRVRLRVPTVRHRTVCRLVCRVGGRWTVTPVQLWPPSILAPARGRIAALLLAALDPSGRLQAALRAEGVNAEPFETAIQRMVFDGRVLVLALGEGAALPEEDWDRLGNRVRRGLTLLVLNPPEGWDRWGLDAAAFDGPLRRPVRLSPQFRQVLRGGDLGTGPWKLGLHGDASVIPLAWPAPAGENAPASRVPDRMLIGARPLGEGTVVAATVPRLDRASEDPVGRTILAELLLWVARRQEASGSGMTLKGRMKTLAEGESP